MHLASVRFLIWHLYTSNYRIEKYLLYISIPAWDLRLILCHNFFFQQLIPMVGSRKGMFSYLNMKLENITICQHWHMPFTYDAWFTIVHACGYSHDFDDLKQATTNGWFEEGGALYKAQCSNTDCYFGFDKTSTGTSICAHVCSGMKMKKTEGDCLFAICSSCYVFKDVSHYSWFNVILLLGGNRILKLVLFIWYTIIWYIYTQPP